jgi:hypothetical protein
MHGELLAREVSRPRRKAPSAGIALKLPRNLKASLHPPGIAFRPRSQAVFGRAERAERGPWEAARRQHAPGIAFKLPGKPASFGANPRGRRTSSTLLAAALHSLGFPFSPFTRPRPSLHRAGQGRNSTSLVWIPGSPKRVESSSALACFTLAGMERLLSRRSRWEAPARLAGSGKIPQRELPSFPFWVHTKASWPCPAKQHPRS